MTKTNEAKQMMELAQWKVNRCYQEVVDARNRGNHNAEEMWKMRFEKAMTIFQERFTEYLETLGISK